MQQKIILIVSVVFGLLAAFLTRSYLNAKDEEVARHIAQFEKKNARIEVVAIAEDVPSGTTLTTGILGSKKVIEGSFRGQVVQASEYMSLIGRKLARGMRKGDILFWSDIEGGSPLSQGLAADVKQRMRAISINVSGAASVSGMVKPGNSVDVIGTFSFPSKTTPGEMELVTFTVLQDVLVLATGRETTKSQLLSESHASSYNMVTLQVTLREAEILVFAEQIKGRLSLALRNPNDTSFEKKMPRVDFERIQRELENLNDFRQNNKRMMH